MAELIAPGGSVPVDVPDEQTEPFLAAGWSPVKATEHKAEEKKAPTPKRR